MTWSSLDRGPGAWDPFADLLDGFWVRPFSRLWGRSPLGRDSEAYPALNVWAGSDDAVLTAELPGVKPEDIHVSVEGDTLKLSARREPLELAEGERYHRQERSAGEFSRALTLPFRMDPAKVEATYQRGVLRVAVARAAEDRPRKIAVKSA